MLRLIIGALITLSLVLGPLGALAAELRIGVADPDAILANSPEGKRVQEAIRRKSDELGRPLGTKRQDIGRQMEEYQRQASMMKEDAKKRKEEELTKKAQEFQRQAADAERLLNQFKESQIAPLSRKMDQALEEVAKEEKLDLILDRRQVLYLSNKAMDVNDKVRTKFIQ